jgi:2-dehydropantoate 2-reductase
VHVDPVQVVGTPGAMPRCDVVLVALKTHQNHALAEILPKVLAPDGLVVLLQTGLDPEHGVTRWVAPERLVGGLRVLCAATDGPGRVRHWDLGSVTFAPYRPDAPAALVARLDRVVADFVAGGVPAQRADDLAAARWRKLVWNVAYNGLSVVLDADTATLMADPAARALAAALMGEAAQAAACLGKPLDAGIVEAMLALTDTMPAYDTSMKIDYDRGLPLELDAIIAAPLHAAEARGAALPRWRMLHEALQFRDRHRRDTSPPL